MTQIGTLLGTGPFVSSLFSALATSVALSLISLFFLFFLRALLRKEWLAIALGLVILFFLSAPFFQPAVSGQPLINNFIALASVSLGLFVLRRFGLVALILSLFVVDVFRIPMTMHAPVWYSTAGYAALFVIAAITVFGFRTSLGGRSLLHTRVFED